MTHIDLGTQDPASYKALYALTVHTEEAAVAAGLDPLLLELVKIRASQINGCAFCLRMHVRDAVKKGETSDRLAVVAAWWESQYFSLAEQAALSIAEQVSTVSSAHFVKSSVIESGILTDAQVAAITWVAITINAWNRVAIASHYPVAP